jgi:hypothetical protein
MKPTLLIPAALLLGLSAGCGQVTVPESLPTTTGAPAPTTADPAVTVAAPAPGPAAPSSTSARPATTTTMTSRPAPTTTIRAATTTTTRPLTRAEATSRLCKAVEAADAAIQAGNLVGGGLRLSAGISAYEKTADPAVVTGARSMLRAGLDGDPEAYGDARRATSTACTRAGTPINLGGGIQCITTPCP